MTTTADILAVQRAHAEHGSDAAVAEIRRRWPLIDENTVERTPERILDAPVDVPASSQKWSWNIRGKFRFKS